MDARPSTAVCILTRPLGASIGDYLSQPKADGGLGLGTTVTSLMMLGRARDGRA